MQSVLAISLIRQSYKDLQEAGFKQVITSIKQNGSLRINWRTRQKRKNSAWRVGALRLYLIASIIDTIPIRLISGVKGQSAQPYNVDLIRVNLQRHILQRHSNCFRTRRVWCAATDE